MRIGTVRRPHGRVRMRKYVVTEMVSVPVRREEVRLEYEPIADGEAVEAASPEEPFEMVLHEEQLILDRRVVATERVRLVIETVTEHATVSETIRTEHVTGYVEPTG